MKAEYMCEFEGEKGGCEKLFFWGECSFVRV